MDIIMNNITILPVKNKKLYDQIGLLQSLVSNRYHKTNVNTKTSKQLLHWDANLYAVMNLVAQDNMNAAKLYWSRLENWDTGNLKKCFRGYQDEKNRALSYFSTLQKIMMSN